MQRDLCFYGTSEEAEFRRSRVRAQIGHLRLNEAMRLAVWLVILAKTCRSDAHTASAARLSVATSLTIFAMPANTPLK